MDSSTEITVFDAQDDGGQTCRMVVLLSAITKKPVRIENLKMTPHLVDIVKWFEKQTAASVVGNEVGSETLEFRPTQRANSKTTNTIVSVKGARKNKYVEDVAKRTHQATTFKSDLHTGSAITTFQTILPLLLMIGNFSGHRLGREVIVEGATNCQGSPSFEYLKQVFEPALKDYFGIDISCKLEKRGWGQAPVSKGVIKVMFKPLLVTPLAEDATIKVQEAARQGIEEGEEERLIDTEVQQVVATIVAPAAHHKLLRDVLHEAMITTFAYLEEDVLKINTEDSKQAHIYVLLVVHSTSSRWAKDWQVEPLQSNITNQVKGAFIDLCTALEQEVSYESNCPIDQNLQEQLVIYQALAEGKSLFPGAEGSGQERARAIATKMLGASFSKTGVCTGAGVRVGQHVQVDVEKKQQLEKQ